MIKRLTLAFIVGYVICVAFMALCYRYLPYGLVENYLISLTIGVGVWITGTFLIALRRSDKSAPQSKDARRKVLLQFHSTVGLAVAMAIFILAVSGIGAYYKDALTVWSLPSTWRNDSPAVTADVAQTSMQAATAAGHGSFDQISIRYPLFPGAPMIAAFEGGHGAHSEMARKMIVNGQVEASLPERDAGDFVHVLHTHFHLPQLLGGTLVGIVAVLFCMMIASGLMMHRQPFKTMKRIVPRKGKPFWVDAHNAIGLWMLPVHVLFAFTGALGGLLLLTALPLVMMFHGGNPDAFFSQLVGSVPPPAQVASNALKVDRAINDLDTQWPEFKVRAIEIVNAGDRNARVLITGDDKTSFTTANSAMARADTGQLIKINRMRTDGPVRHGFFTMLQVHFLTGVSAVFKALFSIFAIGLALLPITGAVLWTRRHLVQSDDPALQRKGRFLIGSMAGVCTGLLLGFGGFLLVYRSATALQLGDPYQLSGVAFLLIWLGAILWASFTTATAGGLKTLAALAGILFLAVPATSSIVGNSSLAAMAVTSTPFIVEAVVALLGLVLLAIAFSLKKQERAHASDPIPV